MLRKLTSAIAPPPLELPLLLPEALVPPVVFAPEPLLALPPLPAPLVDPEEPEEPELPEEPDEPWLAVPLWSCPLWLAEPVPPVLPALLPVLVEEPCCVELPWLAGEL